MLKLLWDHTLMAFTDSDWGELTEKARFGVMRNELMISTSWRFNKQERAEAETARKAEKLRKMKRLQSLLTRFGKQKGFEVVVSMDETRSLGEKSVDTDIIKAESSDEGTIKVLSSSEETTLEEATAADATEAGATRAGSVTAEAEVAAVAEAARTAPRAPRKAQAMARRRVRRLSKKIDSDNLLSRPRERRQPSIKHGADGAGRLRS